MEPSSSPVLSPILVQELLKLIFSSHINETLEIDLGFSKNYSSDLLTDDPRGCDGEDVVDTFGGVPSYPLYKHLAVALHRCINSGSFWRLRNAMMSIQEDDCLKLKETDWNKLIVDKGSELVNMLKAVEFELHVQEPFFAQLRVGLKTIEGRCAAGDYNRIAPGALLLINKCLILKVQHVKKYASFADMLEVESLAKVLPGVKTIEEGVQIYRMFYTEEKEKMNGVLAICVSRPAVQPYISMASIVSGLSYEGVGCLLGLVHTAGTVPDALPPPKSSLLSSFMTSSGKCGTFTDGARALSKHVLRSSEGWWGSFDGSGCHSATPDCRCRRRSLDHSYWSPLLARPIDSNKNKVALEVISHLINQCCWMNIHQIQPYECVFEIRVDEGYGARWFKDGSKFIGFLEPHMEDGHSKRWKH